jgi:putative Ca2+/H+ antiporter (TMEM165/GDT1 family)
MNPEKVVFGFFIVMALTLNFGFVLGDIDNPAHHHHYELFAAIVVNFIATVLKFGDRSQVGAILLATSFVADLQLIATAIVWGLATAGCSGAACDPLVAEAMPSIVSLSGGALLANIISVLLLVVETITLGR